MRSTRWAAYAAIIAATLVFSTMILGAVPAALQQGSCVTPDPFVTIGGGTCINGGWIPSSALTPPPPIIPITPPPAAGCVTPDPFVSIGGGTCVNGGWVPGQAAGAPPPPPIPPQTAVGVFAALEDAVPGKYFDAAGSAVSPGEPNRLLVAFNSGADPATLLPNDFRATTGSNTTAMDTISFTVQAPAGFYVSRITYSQQGAGSLLRGSVEAGSATWVVDGRPAVLGVFGSDPTLTATADLTGLNRTSVPVSITLALFASTGSVVVNAADVLVEFLPIVG
jgi:hypothetical protein